ncbi:MAG TPA: TonB-dependent receptor [Allosphingosinicella sp.]|nr:TonB-dependent receptor [Allosphingosinicella sp.]
MAVALQSFGEQAGITIGASDPQLSQIRSRPVRGQLTLRQALRRLLAGTGYTYRFAGPSAVRIERAAPAAPRRAAASPKPAPVADQPDIVVTASKQNVPLVRFAGSAHVLPIPRSDAGRFGARGSEMILAKLPMVASTNLGPGRNKLYIRGIADSSFNGPSQSVAGEYLGDLRLTFNAPDPDLRLYDIASVEVIEGPQGTLYGSGALGGILRLVPNPVDLTSMAANGSVGAAAVRHGDSDRDAAAMINLPLASGRLGLRAVAYGSIEGGYIDDLERQRNNVNRTATSGARGLLAWEPALDWHIELGGVAQYISGRDGQYAIRGLPPLSRRSAIAQPFDNDYANAYLSIRKRWDNIELLSVNALVRHSIDSLFDATGLAGTQGPQAFAENVDITLLSSETRLSRRDAKGNGWLLGTSLLYSINDLSRTLGPAGTHMPIQGVRNAASEAAIFGQYGFALTDAVSATIGGRLTYSIAAGRGRASGEDARHEPKRTDYRVLPTFAVAWQPFTRFLVYSRYQEGFRAGGLAVSASESGTTAQRFRSDTLASLEFGARYGHGPRDPLSFDAALSYARWNSMQADLIDSRGLPYTTNVGDGRIFGFEAAMSWQPAAGVRFELSTFVNDSALAKPAPAFAAANERDLPNIAKAGARAGVHIDIPIAERTRLSLDGSARYVGRSQLAVGAPIDVPQGKYASGDFGIRLGMGRVGLSLDVANVTDSRGNRFSYGNPFIVAERRETTPLQPRTVRIGLDAAF